MKDVQKSVELSLGEGETVEVVLVRKREGELRVVHCLDSKDEVAMALGEGLFVVRGATKKVNG